MRIRLKVVFLDEENLAKFLPIFKVFIFYYLAKLINLVSSLLSITNGAN